MHGLHDVPDTSTDALSRVSRSAVTGNTMLESCTALLAYIIWMTSRGNL
jgi:hypothetical protein